ncbi:hypothetical protein [Nocardia sp. CY41]|uniref:hypothetical protein n=1 Tax=Nocardia sp. CY41 TaxID=2608686 RepID=UPI00135C92E1|nr:hypothetical protein [Nocardia sp. CY41]
MKVFHCVAASTNYESHWQIPDYRWALWCAAFQVKSLDGYFDLTPAESAIQVLTWAIDRFDTDTETLRKLHSPEDRLDLRANKRHLQGIRKFLIANGGTISGAIDESELTPPEGDTVVVLDSP